MSDAIGSTRDLDAGKREALQGLLSSLGYPTGENTSSTLSAEQLKNLSQKIDDILGEGTDRGLISGEQPGQFVNEDGLPIIDISEPADEASQTNTPLSVLEQDVIPLFSLTPDERQWRRRECDRILDLLEEEERLQQLQEERDAEEERREAIQKRKESAKAELEQIKAARELQKKMGQALVRAEDSLPKPSSVAKKTVSFVDAPVAEASEEKQTTIYQSDWGDVVPGRLRAQGHIPLVDTTQAHPGEYPMKMHVMERHPAGTLASPLCGADSDDESVSSAGHLSSRSEDITPGEENGFSSSDNDLSDDPLKEELDYDVARHHREIALEYHKRRHAVGAEATKVLDKSTLDESEQREFLNRQFPLSRFQADRMVAAYGESHGPISTSVGQSVIPASRQESLRNSVRLGKLENDQLVGGGSGESGSENETVREVIQLLQMGSIQNIGPDFKPPSTSTVAPQNSTARKSPPVGTSSPLHGPKPSRFKLARAGGHTEISISQDDESGNKARLQPAISSVVERKVPEPVSIQPFPVNNTSLVSEKREKN